MERTHVSTDGAELSGANFGGWGVVIRTEDGTETLSGNVEDTTNQRMELRAIYEGLKEMPDGEEVLVRSDSEYALGVAFEGNTYPVKDQLMDCGLEWDYDRRVYITWSREEWEVAVEKVDADINSESEAVIK